MTLQQMKQLKAGDVFVDSAPRNARQPMIGVAMKQTKDGIVARGIDDYSKAWFMDYNGKDGLLLPYNDRTAAMLQVIDSNRIGEPGYLI